MTSYPPPASEEQSEISLTPMLDVVFILLIFFVVTATFARDFGLPSYTVPASPLPPEADSITVRVEGDSNFSVNGRVMARASLAPYVRSMKSEFPDANFAVVVTEGSLVEDTVAAIDAGRRAGFERVPVTTDR